MGSVRCFRSRGGKPMFNSSLHAVAARLSKMPLWLSLCLIAPILLATQLILLVPVLRIALRFCAAFWPLDSPE